MDATHLTTAETVIALASLLGIIAAVTWANPGKTRSASILAGCITAFVAVIFTLAVTNVAYNQPNSQAIIWVGVGWAILVMLGTLAGKTWETAHKPGGINEVDPYKSKFASEKLNQLAEPELASGELNQEQPSKLTYVTGGVMLAGAVAILGWALFTASIMPVYAWTANSRHMTTVLFWEQNGFWSQTPNGLFGQTWSHIGEIPLAWAWMLRLGSLHVGYVQTAFAVIGALAVYSIAKGLKVKTPLAVTAGGLFILTPLVAAGMPTAYTDITAGALALSAVAFWLSVTNDVTDRKVRRARYTWVSGKHKEPGEQGESNWENTNSQTEPCWGAPEGKLVIWTVFGGVSGVLAVGANENVLIPLTVFFVWTAGRILQAKHKNRLKPATAGTIGVVLVLVLLGGAWTAQDNLAATNQGMSTSLVGSLVGGGERENPAATTPPELQNQKNENLKTPKQNRTGEWETVFKSWTHIPQTYVYDQRLGGLGPQWLLLMAGFLVFGYKTWKTHKTIFWNVAVPFVPIFLLTPDVWWAKNTLVLAGIGIVGFVWAADNLKAPWVKATAQILLIGLVAVGGVKTIDRIDLTGQTWTADDIQALSRQTVIQNTTGNLILNYDQWASNITSGSKIAFDPNDIQHEFYYVLSGNSQTPHTLWPLEDSFDNAKTLHEELCAQNVDYLRSQPGHHLSNLAKTQPEWFELHEQNDDVSAWQVSCQ